METKKTMTVAEADAIVKNTNNEITIENAEQHSTEIAPRLNAMQHIADIIKSALKEGINNDYSTIPGTNKPTLLQPGARKVALLFGLTPEYKATDKVVDYNVKWIEKKLNYQTKQWYQTEVQGHFEYEYQVDLKDRNGNLIASGVGSCCNREKGKSDMPANSIMKMAKKRAFVDAVLSIANLSELFTQDMEELNKKPVTTTTATEQPKTTTSSTYTPYTSRYNKG